MPELTESNVCAIRRLAWTSPKPYKEMADEYGVTLKTITDAVQGKTWSDAKCQYGPFIGDREALPLLAGDQADMMQWRVDGSTYAEISERSGYSINKVHEVLNNPDEDAHKIFLRNNGYRFKDDQRLSLGIMTPKVIIAWLELRKQKVTIPEIAERWNVSESLVMHTCAGRRGGEKFNLAAQYMRRKYGSNWRKGMRRYHG